MKAIILAAGEGKRMNSSLPKVLHEILEKPVIHYVLDAVQSSGINQICVVLGHKREQIKNSICTNKNIDFAVQVEQLGTGHAVMCASNFIEDSDDICILPGDTPLIRSEHLKEAMHKHKSSGNDITVISVVLQDPTGYGRIVRQGSDVKIVEHGDATQEQRQICEINTGIMCFKAEALKTALSKLQSNNSQSEYYLTDTLHIIQSDGGKAEAIALGQPQDFLGINTKVQLHEAARIMQTRINEQHMLAGVNIIHSDTAYISPSVTIGRDTLISPNVTISGNTVIGENCTIGSNSTLTDMVLGDNVHILNSVATTSVIKNGAHIGPFAYIRPNSEIGENVKIGDFVEIKNSVIGSNSKASHLTYIGDAVVGSGVNFGCGTVVVNYDGENKFTTTIEDGVFVGCNANLVAPVIVEKGAYIAAGSTITETVPTKSLAIARSRQVNKTNWAKIPECE